MKIKQIKVTVGELCNGFKDDEENGAIAYGGKLVLRPPYQREFIYNDKQQKEVINTIIKKFPLNLMYWSVADDGHYEMLDGQQRSISIARFVDGKFSVNNRYFKNHNPAWQEDFEKYELSIYICEGTPEEKVEWFRVINIAGERLLPQELLNAVYAGPWISDARRYFSKNNCPAFQKASAYFTANLLRQELLEKVIKWAVNRDDVESIEDYMGKHQHDADANDLWIYFCEVMDWAMRLFPEKDTPKKLIKGQEWGLLYNLYHHKSFNINELKQEIHRLMLDDDVTKKPGIVQYLLSDRTMNDEKYLSIRGFTEAQKLQAYEKQHHKCNHCGLDFSYENLFGDHIIPWSKGGHTTTDNLQMLCRTCNNNKSDK